VTLWDVAGGTSRATLEGQTGPVYSVVFAADCKTLASACEGDPTVSFWEPSTGRLVATLALPYAAPGEGVFCLAFAPDAKSMFTGEEQGISVWDVTPTSPALIRIPAPSKDDLPVSK
jgi:WD40 repeat protein